MARKLKQLDKRTTGIEGFDGVTLGGLPASGTTMIMGTTGSGKTVFCLNVIANSLARGKGSVFMTFEESAEQIFHDAASFSWADKLAQSDKFRLIDARQQADIIGSGDFEIDGLLALLDASTKDIDADWVVLDGIDYLLRLHSMDSVSRHFVKFSNWCAKRQVSLLITSKIRDSDSFPMHLDGAEFIVNCVIGLAAQLYESRLNRRIRIIKYRGTRHSTDELPLLLDDHGVHLPYDGDEQLPQPAKYDVTERCSTGIARLDDAIGGGLLRGSTTLISGQPGTSKTTLAARIAEAALQRGERVLYVSFDEEDQRFLNNLTSVGIKLEPYIKKKKLRLETRLAWRYLVEEHYIMIRRMLNEHKPRWLIIDPVSALMKTKSVERTRQTIERLLSDIRMRGINSVLTSLAETDRPEEESTLSHASTLADSWISLTYNVYGGERNRALSVVKSRGTAHTNQVRELTISKEGIDLEDVYQYGSEVLMGTARVQKQLEEEQKAVFQKQEMQHREKMLLHELENAREKTAFALAKEQRLAEELDLAKQYREFKGEEATDYFQHVFQSRSPDSGRKGPAAPQPRRTRKKNDKRGNNK